MPDDMENGLPHDMPDTASLEQVFLENMKEPAILIYQLRPDENLRYYHFTPMDELRATGLSVERRHYEPLYVMTAPTTETQPDKLLEEIFYMFNMNRPADFRPQPVRQRYRCAEAQRRGILPLRGQLWFSAAGRLSAG